MLSKKKLAFQLNEIVTQINKFKPYLLFNSQLEEIFNELFNLSKNLNIDKIDSIIELIVNFKSYHKYA